MKEETSFKVYIRIRPLNNRELTHPNPLKRLSVVNIRENAHITLIDPTGRREYEV
jgi:hypothetical protein